MTTTMLMEAVKAGAGRETAHAAIKEHALAAAAAIRAGAEPELLNRLAADSRLGLPRAKLAALLRDAKRFVGAAPQQADTFARTVAPLARKVAGAGSYQPGKLL